MNYHTIRKQVLVGVSVIVALALIFGLFGTVGAGERGVKTRFNAVTGNVLEEGLYFKLPLVERVIKMNVQVQKVETHAMSASKDLQSVTTVLAINYHLDPASVARIYQEYRQEYSTRLLEPVIQEAVKNATSQFTAEELITKRSSVRDTISSNVQEKLLQRGFIVDEVNIVNFDFSASFNEAIERKVTAEQDALAAENRLEQVKFEAQQRIEEAKGKAEAIRIESDALRNNPDVLELRALEKWDGVLPAVTGGAVPFITIQ